MPHKLDDQFSSACLQMGIKLEEKDLCDFETLAAELSVWSTRFNLTAIRDREGIFLRHFLDSLTLVQAFRELNIHSPFSLLDIGCGAGFPGIPLKIVFRDLRLTLIEATGKKVAFLEHMVALLRLSDVNVLHGRAEDLAHHPDYREQFECVTARAVGTMPTLIELALPFCRHDGHFIAMKKGDVSDEITAAHKAVEMVGGTFTAQVNVALPGVNDERSLIVYRKTIASPERFPRRAGMPEARPLK